MIDVNVYQEHIFHTKCKLKEFDLNNYLFGYTQEKLSVKEREEITKKLKTEMDEIFYGKNMNHGSIEEDLDDNSFQRTTNNS